MWSHAWESNTISKGQCPNTNNCALATTTGAENNFNFIQFKLDSLPVTPHCAAEVAGDLPDKRLCLSCWRIFNKSSQFIDSSG